MVAAGRLVVALAFVGFLAGPLFADVIPSQHATKSDDGAKVQARLVELGVSADEARLRAARLTDEQAAYFARDTDRIRFVGQSEPFAGQSDNFSEEWIFGIVALTGAFVALIHFGID